MKLQSLFALLIIGLSCGTVSAQVNLKDLRVKPDSVISENKQENISLKNIRPVVPKLELQVDYWKHWTSFGVNINQAAFNGDWKGGGVGSTAVGLIANHKSDYTRDNFNFVTEIDLRYGKIKNNKQIAKKNNDRIFWDNKLSYKLSAKWALYTSLTFESQFDAGYKYKQVDGKDTIDYIENAFMAPAYITESLGFEYKPSASYSIRFGTGTARQTLILDNRIKPLTVEQYSQKYPDRAPIDKDQVRYGVEGGKTVQNDLAFQITGNMDKNFTDKLNVKARYNLFANYKKVTDPSHRLDVTVTAKVSRAINVNLNGILVYDTDVISKVQLSESLALGLVYRLPR
ncbi:MULTISPECIES: DUF3078 domain-containing protein [Sphingobacterium]|uniref:DUF3078 domain-containing protein n=1 Tax=Sphingobacterium kitahiroshimense TaxID=470446 RepID=A0ABV0BQQ4_9SPHI|nr:MULTISPECIES: DUF3078 domain-containing protein [Sphingobacterium]KKX51619.1 hypothetical protein L950_0204045 [Sphingobacterium sp. IITKGP-BTPF85]MBB2954509.1 hypothetical protein [Sphingobacterium sp. JUb56]MCW2261843.1 hypothetical protein [Sphingobacterium kitahiroshimense]NJI75570.1 DUF3078 domain-containing protein [Sphingobacterium sp. B16(2022)]TCR10153.1 DUF3078 family protein [Sphingobacterium sp. JUb78]